MIWVKKEDDVIYYYTADNRKFTTIVDATIYITSNYNMLKEQENSFNTCFERNRKLKLIMTNLQHN